MTLVRALLLATIVVPMTGAVSRATPVSNPAMPTVLPDRYLNCVVGLATNIDQTKRQTPADIVSVGRHRFSLRLPPVPVRVGGPPDPSDPPEPIDPRTAVTADPDALMRGVSPVFSRVVDLWPQRVEMIAQIENSPWQQLIIINPIDPAKGRASLFMAPVRDAATMDLKKVYRGECIVAGPVPKMSAR